MANNKICVISHRDPHVFTTPDPRLLTVTVEPQCTTALRPSAVIKSGLRLLSHPGLAAIFTRGPPVIIIPGEHRIGESQAPRNRNTCGPLIVCMSVPKWCDRIREPAWHNMVPIVLWPPQAAPISPSHAPDWAISGLRVPDVVIRFGISSGVEVGPWSKNQNIHTSRGHTTETTNLPTGILKVATPELMLRKETSDDKETSDPRQT